MSDESNDFDGFRVVDGGELADDNFDEFAAPGRSVFGDDDISFEEDDDVIPHWSEPPTGAVPQVGGDASMTFSRKRFCSSSLSRSSRSWSTIRL